MIFQGTRNSTIIPDEHGGIWEEYQFNCKPGDPKRWPCVISPYHYRLDWLMWFAAFQVSLCFCPLFVCENRFLGGGGGKERAERAPHPTPPHPSANSNLKSYFP